MLKIGVALPSASLRRTDVRLTPWNLRALILSIWLSRLYALLNSFHRRLAAPFVPAAYFDERSLRLPRLRYSAELVRLDLGRFTAPS